MNFLKFLVFTGLMLFIPMIFAIFLVLEEEIQNTVWVVGGGIGVILVLILSIHVIIRLRSDIGFFTADWSEKRPPRDG